MSTDIEERDAVFSLSPLTGDVLGKLMVGTTLDCTTEEPVVPAEFPAVDGDDDTKLVLTERWTLTIDATMDTEELAAVFVFAALTEEELMGLLVPKSIEPELVIIFVISAALELIELGLTIVLKLVIVLELWPAAIAVETTELLKGSDELIGKPYVDAVFVNKPKEFVSEVSEDTDEVASSSPSLPPRPVSLGFEGLLSSWFSLPLELWAVAVLEELAGLGLGPVMLVATSNTEVDTANEVDELVREVIKEVDGVVSSSPWFPPLSLDADGWSWSWFLPP